MTQLEERLIEALKILDRTSRGIEAAFPSNTVGLYEIERVSIMQLARANHLKAMKIAQELLAEIRHGRAVQ